MYHAPLAASQTHRWLHCPGSIPFTQQLREIIPEESSEFADEGTYAHKVLDHQLQVMYKSTKPKTEFFNYKDQWAIDVAIEYVQDRIAFNPNAQIFLENYVLPFPKVKDCGGTADIIILTNKELEIIDYKHGRGVFVSPHWNSQLLTYALGAIELTDIPVKRVKMTIVQPRHGEAVRLSPQGNGVMSETLDFDCGIDHKAMKKRGCCVASFKTQLSDGISKVREAQSKAENIMWTMNKAYDEGYLSPGPGRKACRFCDLKSLCPATTDSVTDAEATFAEFNDLDTMDSDLLNTDEVAKLYKLYMKVPDLKKICDAVESMMLRLMEMDDDERPEILDDLLKLEKRYGHRAWSVPQAEIVAAMVKLGVEKKHLFDIKLKSPSKMLALLAKANRNKLNDYIEKPVIGNKIIGF